MGAIRSRRTLCFFLSLLRFGQAIFFGCLVLIFVVFILVVILFRIAEVGRDEGFVFFRDLFCRLRLFHFVDFFAVELQQFNDRCHLFGTQARLALPLLDEGNDLGDQANEAFVAWVLELDLGNRRERDHGIALKTGLSPMSSLMQWR